MHYEPPVVVTYSASHVLATLGPARAIYGGASLSVSPEAAVGQSGTGNLSKR